MIIYVESKCTWNDLLNNKNELTKWFANMNYGLPKCMYRPTTYVTYPNLFDLPHDVTCQTIWPAKLWYVQTYWLTNALDVPMLLLSNLDFMST